eukprot:CAMPEP_0170521936 /NCGR_PEP_ID=MMETSP0209-20121228/7369_1 /TAXON_ID=665100 ORGANISM="Litonotus pictus, Strain P1" /NCGR_SAMPLE_ID=MMETSP0209 /ASSEMBLY_ACC=CAM_ASM_000301 /LENGTH=84 /DNA_ID=CAMNT_0010809155 /DNA_START=93 /DNA_END=343 /DNA_ORIENTATION=+
MTFTSWIYHTDGEAITGYCIAFTWNLFMNVLELESIPIALVKYLLPELERINREAMAYYGISIRDEYVELVDNRIKGKDKKRHS